jgi:hypothetical protein
MRSSAETKLPYLIPSESSEVRPLRTFDELNDQLLHACEVPTSTARGIGIFPDGDMESEDDGRTVPVFRIAFNARAGFDMRLSTMSGEVLIDALHNGKLSGFLLLGEKWQRLPTRYWKCLSALTEQAKCVHVAKVDFTTPGEIVGLPIYLSGAEFDRWLGGDGIKAFNAYAQQAIAEENYPTDADANYRLAFPPLASLLTAADDETERAIVKLQVGELHTDGIAQPFITTGAPGRITAMTAINTIFDERIAAGLLEIGVKAQAEALVQAYLDDPRYPQSSGWPTIRPGSVENNIRTKFNGLRQATN